MTVYNSCIIVVTDISQDNYHSWSSKQLTSFHTFVVRLLSLLQEVSDLQRHCDIHHAPHPTPWSWVLWTALLSISMISFTSNCKVYPSVICTDEEQLLCWGIYRDWWQGWRDRKEILKERKWPTVITCCDFHRGIICVSASMGICFQL
jgi:hypothetical protein